MDKLNSTDDTQIAKVAQLVEHNLAKVGVAGSNPVFRSNNKGLWTERRNPRRNKTLILSPFLILTASQAWD
jgi:ribosomal protein S10